LFVSENKNSIIKKRARKTKEKQVILDVIDKMYFIYKLQLAKAFDDFHKKRPSLKVLPESEIYRLVDEVCEEGKELEK
jgi:hypothetical protein